MNPEVVAAVDELVKRGVIEHRAAVPLRRAASGSLVSVREELLVLLWVGVALISTGVGVLLKQNLQRIGPMTIAVALGIAACACLGWCWRRAETPSFTFDSVLLLGALLAAADLTFVEVKFTPLGAHWPWHLLIVSGAYAGLAFRFDSRSLFSLSLTSFAAWRGVSIVGVATPWAAGSNDDRLFAEALICGVIFLAIGKFLDSIRVKPHFEPAASWLGWLLVLGALAVRLELNEGTLIAATSLVACGAILAWFSWDERSLGRYALGIGGAALGVAGLAGDVIDRAALGENVTLLVVVLLAVAVIALILRAHRAAKATP